MCLKSKHLFTFYTSSLPEGGWVIHFFQKLKNIVSKFFLDAPPNSPTASTPSPVSFPANAGLHRATDSCMQIHWRQTSPVGRRRRRTSRPAKVARGLIVPYRIRGREFRGRRRACALGVLNWRLRASCAIELRGRGGCGSRERCIEGGRRRRSWGAQGRGNRAVWGAVSLP